ncbi:hypothetical protein [Bacillus pseudomycoides]|uniref:hypothetical protein n=1 Tax=Bacillus pseudomycoides TaxID=64104 RepID=UPI001FB24EF2|nr:hypothetical protein [Bacillus pseudomycoides]
MPRVWRENDMDTIFRCAHRFIDGNETDTIGAFPVLTSNPDPSFDLIFVKDNAGIIDMFSDISQSDFAMYYLHQKFEGKEFTHNGQQFISGFPIHEFNGTNAAAALLRPEAVEVRPIGKGDINIMLPHAINNWGDIVRALVNIDKYVKENLENGFVGGFLDCYPDPSSNFHRLLLFKEEYFYRKSIPEWRLKHLNSFQYNFSNPANQALFRKAHNRICSIIDANSCSVLTENDMRRLKEIYGNGIFYHHEGVAEDPTADAEAANGITGMYVNPEYLKSLQSNQSDMHDGLTQLVFHELMHVIGYCHPKDTNDPAYDESIPEKVKLCVPRTNLTLPCPFPHGCNILRSPHGNCPGY